MPLRDNLDVYITEEALDVLKPVTVYNAKNHEVKSFLLGNKEYTEGKIPAGEYEIKNGEQAIYQKVGKNLSNLFTLMQTGTGVANFFITESQKGNLKLDFPLSLIQDSAGKLVDFGRKVLNERKEADLSLPTMDANC